MTDNSPTCYDSMTLGLIKEENFILELIQENLMLWQPLVTKINSNTSNKSLSRILSRDYKRT